MSDKERLLQCLNALGIRDLKESLKDFSERKRIQKTVCLLQHVFGIDFGFHFSWYIHGPYSPDLTDTLFGLSEREPRKVSVPQSKDKDRIDAFRNFVGEAFESANQMELIGSLYFLYYLGKREAEASDDQILATFKEKKPFFSNANVERVWAKRSQIDKLWS